MYVPLHDRHVISYIMLHLCSGFILSFGLTNSCWSFVCGLTGVVMYFVMAPWMHYRDCNLLIVPKNSLFIHLFIYLFMGQTTKAQLENVK